VGKLFHSSAISNLEAGCFITYVGIPLLAKGQVLGAFAIFYRAMLSLEPKWLDFLESITTQATIVIDKAQLFDNLQVHTRNWCKLIYVAYF
jgi:GAF domain-containing protein